MMDWRDKKIDMGSVHIDKDAGDITFSNADCTEDFEVSANEDAEPGMVMALNDVGYQEKSVQPHDKRVAGVISGTGDLSPGRVLGKRLGREDRIPVALMERVHCRVDADYWSVKVGTLLTTLATPGHAMKANDPLKAFGAVIGKALSLLLEGKGLIPITVALQ